MRTVRPAAVRFTRSITHRPVQSCTPLPNPAHEAWQSRPRPARAPRRPARSRGRFEGGRAGGSL